MTHVLAIEAVAEAAWQAGFRGTGTGGSLTQAIARAHAESTFDADVENDSRAGEPAPNGKTWGPAIGLMQIRSLVEDTHTGSDRDYAVLKDPVRNMRAAYSISSGGTSWKAWRASDAGTRSYLATAAGAAKGVSERNGTVAGIGASAVVAGAAGLAIGATDIVAGVTIAQLISPHADYRLLHVTDVSVLGKTLDARLRENVVVGGQIDLTTDAVSELSFVLADPGLAWLRSGVFVRGAAVHLAELNLEIVVRELAQAECEELTITARSSVGMAMKRLRSGGPYSNMTATMIAYELGQAAGARGFVMQAASGGVRSQEIRKEPQDKPGEVESDWDLFTRLGEEEGMLAFESSGILFLGQPSWLIDKMPQVKVGWRKGHGDHGLDAFDVPNCRDTEDAGKGLPATDVTVKLTLAGVGDYDGDYIVTGVSWPWDSGLAPAEIRAVSPVDPIPTAPGGIDPASATADPATAAQTGLGTSATPGSHSAWDFLGFARQQLGDKYVLGAEGPDAFDCSGLVQAAAAYVGVNTPRTAKAIIDSCIPISVEQAAQTPGAVLYHGPTAAGTTGHIVISVGDGIHTIEAKGRAYGVVEGDIGKRFSRGGLIRGLTYPPLAQDVAAGVTFN